MMAPASDLCHHLSRELHAPSLRLSLRTPLDHQSNCLYDAWNGARHLIVKEYLIRDEWTEAPVREYTALEKLAPLDIAPRPVLSLPAGIVEGAGPLVVYEFMEGTMWDRGERTAADLSALANAWIAMNDLPTAGLWPSRGHGSLAPAADRIRAAFTGYASWAEWSFAPGLRALDACLEQLDRCQAVIRSLEHCEPALCFCRADPRFANVIARPAGLIGLVDWEDSGLRDPARDVADLLTHANQEDIVTPELWSAFLDPYYAARWPADPDLDERVRHYLLLFPVYWLARNLQFGAQRALEDRLSAWSINGMSPNPRLRRYLARARAWPNPDFARHLDAAQAIVFFPGIG